MGANPIQTSNLIVLLYSATILRLMSERFLGINIEYEQTDKKALRALVYASQLYGKINGLQIEGALPKEGAAILVSNHTGNTDIFRGCLACVTTSQRIIRGVARESLLDLSVKESDEVLERTGKKGKFDPMTLPLIAPTIAFILNGIGAIPVQRGSERDSDKDKRFLRTTDEILESGQMLGLFMQETRVKAGDLSNPFPGAGVIARRHPDVPIIPITILNKRFGNKMIIGEQTTYKQLAQESDHKLSPAEATALIGDRIAQNHHEIVRIKWQAVDRPQLLAA